ncbi:hypothetical protein K7432_014216 [Basidiobolus ranarum]|uniref:COBRA1-domain-containing protein n=2 Tax=Basidiobolus ranarum TaxID=34480 RepID=A0ABR2VPS4_9FUNG
MIPFVFKSLPYQCLKNYYFIFILDLFDVRLFFYFLLPNIQAIYPLLDHLEYTRAEVHGSFLDSLKLRMLEKIQKEDLDEERFHKLLKKTLPYIHLKELREVPVKLLSKHPERIPKEVLESISQQSDVYAECPVEVKRQLWLNDNTLFRDYVVPKLQRYHYDMDHYGIGRELRHKDVVKITKLRREHSTIKDLVNVIGTNITLYDLVLGFLRTLFLSTGYTNYCTLRFDLLMAMHEADVNEIYEKDPCHQLVWALDACIRTQSMDERRVRDMQKFFDGVMKEDPVYGDIAMILLGPFTANMLSLQLLHLLHTAAAKQLEPKAERNIIWTSTILNLGYHARIMIQTRSFKIPKVDKEVTSKFYSAMGGLIADDIHREENAKKNIGIEDEEVFAEALTESEIAVLGRSEVARKIFCQYTLDRLYESDLVAFNRIVPVLFQVLPTNPSSYEDLFQSVLSLLVQSINVILGSRKLQKILVEDFFIRCTEWSIFAHTHGVKFLAEVQSFGVSNNSPEVLKLVADWAEKMCKIGTKELDDEEKCVALRKAYLALVQNSPPSPFQLNERSAPSIAEFISTTSE